MKAVVTVTAKDAKGIISKVSTKCFEYNANIDNDERYNTRKERWQPSAAQ